MKNLTNFAFILALLIFMPLISATVWEGTDKAGLLQWYTFNSTFNDNSGNNFYLDNHTGSTGNFYYQNSGKHGSAIYFNNSNEVSPSYLFNKTTVNFVAPTLTGTIEAWVNGTFKPDSGSQLLNLMNIYSQAKTGSFNGDRLYINSSGDRIWCQVTRSDNLQVNTETNVSLNKGEWNHIACSWNQSEIDIYLNGVVVLTNYNNMRSVHGGTVIGYCIGVSCTSAFDETQTTYPFVGAIDDVMIWNVTRNISQINDDMGILNSSVNTTLPTPVNQTIMVNFVSPTSSGTITASQTIKANLSVSSLNLTRATVWLYNQSTYLASVNFTTQPFYVEFTNLDNGTYFLNATAINIFGNTSNTETRTIIISYNPFVPPIFNPPSQSQYYVLTEILVSMGAGLAIFISIIAHGFIYLLIALAFVAVIVMIFQAIKLIFNKHN